MHIALDREELAWAGGLFEGEGCFQRQGTSPSATLVMTDEDTVRLFAQRVGIGKILGPYKSTKGKKPVWRWSVHGLEKLQYVMAVLWPWLGSRRRETARLLLSWALLRPGRGNWTRGPSRREAALRGWQARRDR